MYVPNYPSPSTNHLDHCLSTDIRSRFLFLLKEMKIEIKLAVLGVYTFYSMPDRWTCNWCRVQQDYKSLIMGSGNFDEYAESQTLDFVHN